MDLAQDEEKLRSSLRDRSVRSGRLFSPEGDGKAHRNLEAGQGTMRSQNIRRRCSKGPQRASNHAGSGLELADEKFKRQYGPDLCEEGLPAQTYYEEFEEQLAEGRLEAEHMKEIVKPARQHGMHLDGKLTLQTRRRFTSTEPAEVEQLLLGQLRQPGRAMFKDLARGTCESFLKILLNKRDFNYKNEVDG